MGASDFYERQGIGTANIRGRVQPEHARRQARDVPPPVPQECCYGTPRNEHSRLLLAQLVTNDAARHGTADGAGRAVRHFMADHAAGYGAAERAGRQHR